MYQDVIEAVETAALAKASLLRNRPSAALVHAMMAGAYIGLGILFIFMLGTPLFMDKSPFQPVVMGAAFGIALSLVIMAGADLFTGTVMIMPVAALRGRCSWNDAFWVCIVSYIGNFFGSVLVAWLGYAANIFTNASLVESIANKKIHADFFVLLSKGILCNWFVCLAVWSCFRLKSDSGKLIMIWWCLFGFIGSGYEHSIANMTLLTLANLLPHGEEVSWAGLVYNLIPVTIGNIISGGIFMAFAYNFVTGEQGKRTKNSTFSLEPALENDPGDSCELSDTV